MTELSLYQITITALLVGWMTAIILVWVRYDSLPHGKWLLLGILLWPLTLADEWLKLSMSQQSLSFLIGMFQFAPTAIAATLVLSVRQLCVEKYSNNQLLFFLPAVLMLCGQLPLLLLSQVTKADMLVSPPVGDLLTNWPYYATYVFSAFVILSYAVHAAEYFSSYHFYLSDQVVDIDIYQMRVAAHGCVVLMLVAFLQIGIMSIVVFDLLPMGDWPSMINISTSCGLLFVILTLLERRKYSPMPFTEQQISGRPYTDEQLRSALKEAEKAIIQHKAYKRKGLRIRQLADAAQIEPAALALATRFVLKRNFRAFIYHYRLEYAKKVLMRTDQKVTSVAKRLGFNSEKYLSNMFIKYIQVMGKKPSDTPKSP